MQPQNERTVCRRKLVLDVLVLLITFPGEGFWFTLSEQIMNAVVSLLVGWWLKVGSRQPPTEQCVLLRSMPTASRIGFGMRGGEIRCGTAL